MSFEDEKANSSGLYSRAVVLSITTLSNTTLWREIRAGRFPAPIQISPARVAWSREAVDDWLNSKLTEANDAKVA